MLGIDFICDYLILWIAFVSCIYLYIQFKDDRHYPPGPFNIPFLGFLPFILAKHPHEYLAKLRKKYGNIFAFRLGQRYIIVINDYNTLKELMNREEFWNRPTIPPMTMYNENSLTNANGEVYKREKRISMKIIHRLAFGQKFLENVIREEIFYLMKDFKKHENKPCDVSYFLKTSTINNIVSLMFGRRLHRDDNRFRAVLEGVKLFDESNFNGDPTVFFPILKPLFHMLGGSHYRKSLQWSAILESVIKKELEEHKNENRNEDEVKDYLDAYLLEVKKPNSFHSENTLIGNVKAYFIGGSVTASFTMEWFLIAMANNQDIQSRCFEEIKEVIGLEKPAEYSDLTSLPYVRAVMLEALRWKTVTPLSGVRCISKDVEYGDYILPKDTFVFSNIWAVHNDPDIWKKPNEFSPENFLDEDGNVINTEYCIPFGMGRRACPGESIANLEIFLYIVTMLQKYSFHPPDNEKLCTEGVSLFIHYSKPFKILFCLRQ